MLTEWTNTGGNGRASQVWQRQLNGRGALCWVMPHRVLVDLFIGAQQVPVDGVPFAGDSEPFATLTEARAYADRFLGVTT